MREEVGGRVEGGGRVLAGGRMEREVWRQLEGGRILGDTSCSLRVQEVGCQLSPVVLHNKCEDCNFTISMKYGTQEDMATI